MQLSIEKHNVTILPRNW